LSVLQHEARRRAGDFKNRVVRDAASASGAHFPAFGSRKTGEKCKKLQTGQGSFLDLVDAGRRSNFAVQSGIKGVTVYDEYAAAVWFSFVCAGVCLLIVVSAMTERGKTATWKPPGSLNGVALALVAAIFLAGSLLQFATSKGTDHGRAIPGRAHPPTNKGE
jgi:hypothetical protein